MRKRRAILLILTMAATVVLASGVALAVTKQCQGGLSFICSGTKKGDTLLGTNDFDYILGKGGNDTLKGFGSSDELYGGKGNDQIFGGAANDTLHGGLGRDSLFGQDSGDTYAFETNSWGKDTITDTLISDNEVTTANKLFFGKALTTALTINLVSDSASVPEVKNAAGTSTVNWSDNVIDNVENYSSGNDTIGGNSVANYIRSEGGADNISSGGGNDFIDVVDGASDDVVNCGGIIFPDNDTVRFDTGDTVTNCENLQPQ